VTDAYGASATGSVTVSIINQPPSATFTVDRTTGVRGDEFTFTATGSDPDGDPIKFSFRVGEDGTWTEPSSSGIFKQRFTTVGEQSVYARVSDDLGASKVTDPIKVNVLNRAPTVTIISDKTSGVRGETFTFTATGADPDGDALVYSFNGGAFAASNVFRTSFSQLGTPAVRVITRDALNANSPAASVTVNIVNRAPSVSLSVNPAPSTTGQTITFTATGADPDGDALTYSFNVNGTWTAFGPSNTITTQYSTAGNYTGQVIAKDAPGATSNTASAGVTIKANANLTVLASPASYGTPYGSGTYEVGSSPTAQVVPHYGYEFKGWADGWGGANPLSVTIAKDTTVTGTLDRRLFAVTLYTAASAGGGASAKGNYAEVTAHVYNASTGGYLGAFGSAAHNKGANAVDKDWHTVWVPYGDTVYFNGYARVYSIHMGVSWTGGGYHQPEYGKWGWYGKWYNNIGAVQVLGDTTLGYFSVGTPLLIDLSGDNQPDLLAGPQWKFLSDRRPSKDLSHFRSINLDGSGEKRWEWIGPTDGLLVYLPGLEGTPDATRLFGTGTFGKEWKHGYEPLVSLDKDASGALEGDELGDIGIWVDANGDAVAQYGEIRPASEYGVSSLSVGYQKDATGNVANMHGAQLKDKTVAVWDWISYSYPETTAENEVARFDWTDQQPPAEYFAVNAGEGMEKIKMLPGGTLRVHRVNNQLYVRATASLDESGEKVLDVVYPAEVAGDGILKWGTPGISNALMVSGPDFYGLTLGGEKSYGVWTAKLVDGSLDDLFGSRVVK